MSIMRLDGAVVCTVRGAASPSRETESDSRTEATTAGARPAECAQSPIIVRRASGRSRGIATVVWWFELVVAWRAAADDHAVRDPVSDLYPLGVKVRTAPDVGVQLDLEVVELLCGTASPVICSGLLELDAFESEGARRRDIARALFTFVLKR